MADASKYSLGVGVKAADVYDRLRGKRQAVIDMARLMAELTLPSLFPPEGYSTGDDIPGNNQSIGAHCVNTLASVLLYMWFPPNQPIAKFKALEYMIQPQVDQDPDLWARVELALAQLEISHRQRLQTTAVSLVANEYLKYLIVGGNALWKQLKLAQPTAHRPDCYVVKRNKLGSPLLIIHKERVSLMGMEPDHRDFVLAHLAPDHFKDQQEWEKEVDIYSVQQFDVEDDGDPVWHYWEEFDGHALPDTVVTTDADTPPMHAGWLIPVFGQDWGQGYCEQYRGDLYTVEAHASSVNDGASLAALALLFNRPGSQTSIKQVREAKNLSVLSGDAADLTVFRSDKTADLNFVVNNLETVARRLSSAFLLQASIQRNGERVTAEEIRRLGQDIDKGTGGLYTQIAHSNQRPIIMRCIRLNEDENPKLPPLPKGLVDVQVITGMDALGDSTEYDATVDVVGTLTKLFPQEAQKRINVGNLGKRLAAFRGVKPDGLFFTDEQVTASDQAAQQRAISAQLIDKATGPAVKGFADSMNGGGSPPTVPIPTPQQ